MKTLKLVFVVLWAMTVGLSILRVFWFPDQPEGILADSYKATAHLWVGFLFGGWFWLNFIRKVANASCLRIRSGDLFFHAVLLTIVETVSFLVSLFVKG